MAALLREPPLAGDKDDDALQQKAFLRLVRNFTHRVEHKKDDEEQLVKRQRNTGVSAVPTISFPVTVSSGDSLLEEVCGYRADLRASEARMLEAIQHSEERMMDQLRAVGGFICDFRKTEKKLVEMVGELKREKRRTVIEDEDDE